MHKGCPSWSAHGKWRPTGPGGGVLNGSNVSTLQVPSVTHHTRWVVIAQRAFLYPTLLWAATQGPQVTMSSIEISR